MAGDVQDGANFLSGEVAFHESHNFPLCLGCHLSQIISYFNDKRIEIHNPLPAYGEDKDYVADLNLLKEKFGITVIIPQKLADDARVLKFCGLDKLLEQYWNSNPRSKRQR